MPLKSFVREDQFHETLGPRCAIAIDEKCRHTGQLARFKSVAENEREHGRQNEEQNQDTLVPIDVEEFFVSHTRHRAEETSLHDWAGLNISS